MISAIVGIHAGEDVNLGYIIFFTVIMSIIAFFTGQGPSSAYGPYY